MDAQDRPGWNPPELPSVEPTSPDSPDVVASSAPRRSRVGTGIAIAAIAIGALGVAGTAYASSSSPSPTPDAGERPHYGGNGPSGATGPQGTRPGKPGGGFGHDRDGMHGGPGKGMGGFGMGLGMPLHGSYVTAKQGGGYQTVDVQQGTVTAVSSTSLTVKSVDGFSQTYVVNADTQVHADKDGIGSIKVGDEVGVMAVQNGSEHDAVQIVDRTQLGGPGGKPGGNPGGKHGAMPSPSPTSTA
jgi:hypothetical protein